MKGNAMEVRRRLAKQRYGPCFKKKEEKGRVKPHRGGICAAKRHPG